MLLSVSRLFRGKGKKKNGVVRRYNLLAARRTKSGTLAQRNVVFHFALAFTTFRTLMSSITVHVFVRFCQRFIYEVRSWKFIESLETAGTQTTVCWSCFILTTDHLLLVVGLLVKRRLFYSRHVRFLNGFWTTALLQPLSNYPSFWIFVYFSIQKEFTKGGIIT